MKRRPNWGGEILKRARVQTERQRRLTYSRPGVFCPAADCAWKAYLRRALVSSADKEPASNIGRRFYGCGKDKGDEDRCDYFQWCDEPRPLGVSHTGLSDLVADGFHRSVNASSMSAVRGGLLFVEGNYYMTCLANEIQRYQKDTGSKRDGPSATAAASPAAGAAPGNPPPQNIQRTNGFTIAHVGPIYVANRPDIHLALRPAYESAQPENVGSSFGV